MAGVVRCQIVPEAGRQVSFQIDGREVLRWHEGLDYPRPYFYPVVGPSGCSVTRMGHPGAPNHDHHQSLWFAHNKVLGIDFWGNSSGTRIRQQQWLAYEDADDACRMAVELHWFDGHDPAALMKQELICEVRPVSGDVDADAGPEYTVELQSRFRPVAAQLELGQTNFGFLAVRVARSISAVFGGGQLTSGNGSVSESQIFGQAAPWMDYSGPVDLSGQTIEGIAYMDHPSNPGQPTCWHVRDDGWMCASPCMNSSLIITADLPLTLRYLLFVHRGAAPVDRISKLQAAFQSLPEMHVMKSKRPHIQWQIERMVTA